VSDSDKHYSLVQYRTYYACKKFCITGPWSIHLTRRHFSIKIKLLREIRRCTNNAIFTLTVWVIPTTQTLTIDVYCSYMSIAVSQCACINTALRRSPVVGHCQSPYELKPLVVAYRAVPFSVSPVLG